MCVIIIMYILSGIYIIYVDSYLVVHRPNVAYNILYTCKYNKSITASNTILENKKK